jgi:hypothetical protein
LNVDEQGSGLYCGDTNGEHRAGLGVREQDGQAGLNLSAAQKDRHIRMKAGQEGELLYTYPDKDTPIVGLGLTDGLIEGEDEEPTAAFAITDKDGGAAVVLSTGPRGEPHVRLLDRHHKVSGSCELGAHGKPALYAFDQEGADGRSGKALERAVERGPLYHAILFSASLILGGVGGAWLATSASAVSGSHFAAFITGAALIALAALLFLARRRGW